MRIIIDIADNLVKQWGGIFIDHVQIEIEKSIVAFPGFIYDLPQEKDKVTFLTRIFKDGDIPIEYATPEVVQKLQDFMTAQSEAVDSAEKRVVNGNFGGRKKKGTAASLRNKK